MKTIFIDNQFQEIINDLQENKKSGNIHKEKELAEVLEKKAKKAQNYYAEAVSYYYHANYWTMSKKPLITMEYCQKAKKICMQYEYYDIYVFVCMEEGTANVYLDRRQSAMNCLLDSYYVSVEKQFIDIQGLVLNNIGAVFYHIEKYEIALKYYKKAHRIQKKYLSNIETAKEILAINIANTYIRLKQYDSFRKWEEEEISQLKRQTIPFVRYSMMVNHILLERKAEKKEEVKQKILCFLAYMEQQQQEPYFISLLFDIIGYCLEIKNIEISKKSIQIMEVQIENSRSYKNQEKLSFLKTKLYQLSGEQEELFQELLTYRDLSWQSGIQRIEEEYNGILSRINLSREEYKRKYIERKNKELKRKSELDSFTGFLNKVAFERIVQERLEKEEKENDVVLLLDIDHFKSINDTYGHTIGDQVIYKISEVIKESTTEKDYLGRIGGDEFCVYLLDIPYIDKLEEWVQKLMDNIHEIQCDNIKKGGITASIGMVKVKEEKNIRELLEKVDESMYYAKKKGKDTYHIQ